MKAQYFFIIYFEAETVQAINPNKLWARILITKNKNTADQLEKRAKHYIPKMFVLILSLRGANVKSIYTYMYVYSMHVKSFPYCFHNNNYGSTTKQNDKMHAQSIYRWLAGVCGKGKTILHLNCLLFIFQCTWLA